MNLSELDFSVPNTIGVRRAHIVARDTYRTASAFGNASGRVTSSGARIETAAIAIDIRVSSASVDVSVGRRRLASGIAQARGIVNNIRGNLQHVMSNRYESMPCKVFGIGLGRTGTNSLHLALSRLGFFGIHYAPFLTRGILNRQLDRSIFEDYDSFVDTPFWLAWKELDKAVPGSKFILTVRDPDAWLRSFRWLLGDSSTPSTRAFFGVDRFDAAIYRKKYLEHNAAVTEYFRGREKDFIVFDVENGSGWKELCEFVDRPVPLEPNFPRSNQKRGQESQLAARRARLDF